MTFDDNAGHSLGTPGGRSSIPQSVASSNLYTPDTGDETTALTQDLGQALFSAGQINAEQLTSARSMVEKSPGKRIADVFLEMGVDETAVQQARAKVAGVPTCRVTARPLPLSSGLGAL